MLCRRPHKICIIIAIIFLVFVPYCAAFCPPGCECRDDQFLVACNSPALTSIPILLNPMLKTLVITNSNGLKLDSFSIALYQQLESLELSNNQITRIPSNFLSRLTKLRTLNLRGNKMKVIDGATKEAKNLEHLDLSSNQIEHILPNSFANFGALLHLNLSHNHLHAIDRTTFTGLTNLTDMDLRQNRISKLDNDQFDTLSELANLGLSGNLISELMAKPFSSLEKLRNLDLSSNLISCMEKDAFSGLQRLESLNLARNLLSTPTSEAIDGCRRNANWEHLIGLKKLDLSGNAWAEIPARTFDGGLWKLRELRLEQMSQLREIRAEAFVGLPKLGSLFLTNSTFLSYIDPKSFIGTNSLEQLDLANCQLSTIDQNLVNWSMLKKVGLSGNRWNCDCELVSFLPKILEIHHHSAAFFDVLCASPEEFRDLNILFVATNFSSTSEQNFLKCSDNFGSSSAMSLKFLLDNPKFAFLASAAGILLLLSLTFSILCFCGSRKKNCQRNFCKFCFCGKIRKANSVERTIRQQSHFYAPGSASYTESLIAYEPSANSNSTQHFEQNARIGQNMKHNSTGFSIVEQNSNTYSSNEADEYYSSIGPENGEERRELPPLSPPPPPPPFFGDPFSLNLPPNLFAGTHHHGPIAVPPYQLRNSSTLRRNDQRPPSILAPPLPPLRRMMPNY
ncbi:hypothetical protein niasHS_009799 [Heterodera schachtii]|uniref:LRRCT domain-containing protein n=2 Tax=Heterodera TaxID=34509 RepID=A0ABD2JAE2_HETSC